MGIRDIYEKNPNLSYEAAIRTVGSEELLSEVAAQFGENAMENIEAIERFLFARDYKNFTIKVHSLKSSAKMIGEERLSRLATDMEALGKRAETGDRDAEKRIIRLIPETIDRYLRAGLSLIALSEAKEQEGVEEAPEGYMESFYESASAYVEDYDSDGLEGLFKKTDAHRIPESEAERYKALKKAYNESDWDEMQKLTESGGA